MQRSNGIAVAAVALLLGVVSAPMGAQVAGAARGELTAAERLEHALNRLTFGARPGDIDRVRATGLAAWIDRQLDPRRIDDSAFERFARQYRLLNADHDEMLAEYNAAQRERRVARRDSASGQMMDRDDSIAFRQLVRGRRGLMGEIQSHRVARAVASNRQLEEVLVDFWLNHFSVFAQKGPPQAYYLAAYERDAIRPHALGRFRDLLGAVAKSPAMLFYLDNARSMGDTSQPRLRSARDGPLARRRMRRLQEDAQQQLQQLRSGGLNENYGRELLELHTLGADGGYTQRDVIEVARALTGWTIRQPAAGGGFIFRPAMHDAGEKTVLGRKLRAGRGIEDGEEVLDILARHPSTARHIATKLATRFVSDEPPAAVVDRATQVFLKTDGDIRAVVRSIVTSDEFYSRSAWRAKVKSPFEVVVSALRSMNAEPDPTPRTAQVIAYLGQPIYGHQAPNGWPETGDAWMNAGALLKRVNLGTAVSSGNVPGVRPQDVPGFDSLAVALGSPDFQRR